MKKQTFRAMVSQCMRACGKTMSVGDITLRSGKIYNPANNCGRETSYSGPLSIEKTTDYMWRKAKVAGEFKINSETIKL